MCTLSQPFQWVTVVVTSMSKECPARTWLIMTWHVLSYVYLYKECAHAGGNGWNLVQVLQYWWQPHCLQTKLALGCGFLLTQYTMDTCCLSSVCSVCDTICRLLLQAAWMLL